MRFVQCYSLRSHKVCCTLVLYFALFSNFLLCLLCLTNIGFVQCFSFGSRKVRYTLLLRISQRVLPHKHRFCAVYPLGSRKVCCTLLFNLFYLFLCSNFGFACFASQTPALCSAIPSAPVKFVARLCLTLLYSVIFVLRALPHKHRVCVVLLPPLPSSLLHACVYFILFSNFLLCVFCLTNIGLVQCFSLRLPSSLRPFGFLCFIQFAFVMRALPNKLRFVQ